MIPISILESDPVYMYDIIPVTPEDATQFFMNDPKLALLGLADEELAIMFTTGSYKFAPGSNYIGLADKDGALVSIAKYEYFTTHTINWHMYMRSSLHGLQDVQDMVTVYKDFVANELKIYKVMLIVPSTCEHIHKFAPKCGFVKEGCITNSYQWRQQLVDLIIYGLDLSSRK